MNPPAFRYKAVATQRHSWTAVSLCWIVSSLLGFTPLLGWNNFHLEPLNSTNASPSALGSRPCTFLSVVSLPFMVYFNFLGCVMTPLLVITLLYARVFWSLQGRLRDSCPQAQVSLLRERRLACSLSLVLILFTGCWIPLHLMNCLLLFAGPDAVPQGAVYTGRRTRLHSCCFFGFALFVSELLYKRHLGAVPPWRTGTTQYLPPFRHRRILWCKSALSGILLSHANSAINPVVYAYRIPKIKQACGQMWRRYLVHTRNVDGQVQRPRTESRTNQTETFGSVEMT